MEPVSLNGTLERLKLHSNGTDSAVPPQAAPPTKKDEANGQAIELLKPRDWAWATLVKNDKVTAQDWWQDVREIELELEDSGNTAYPPGSICSLQPRMSAQEVDDFLEANDLVDEADETFYLRPKDPGELYLLKGQIGDTSDDQINHFHLIFLRNILPPHFAHF
jgi:sulfite reductase alpha subunit-like flavoprotein